MKVFLKVFISLFIILISCKKNENGETEVIPLAPSNLQVSQLRAPTQIDLTWTDNSTNESGFKIERKLVDGNYQIIGTLASDVSSFTDNNVEFGKPYTYRVYAFNSTGKSLNYSNEATLSTANYPTVNTAEMSEIMAFSAVSGGSISFDGGIPITAKGVVWSTSQNPTIDLPTKTTDGGGTVSFISRMTNLNVNTTYYVRAYASNALLTGYGSQKSFQTPKYGIVAGGNGAGFAANQLNNPQRIFIDPSGNIYISDSQNNRIQKWAPGATSGTTVAGGNGAGSAANQLNFPTGVFVDASGNVYIVDCFNHRIQKWAPGATSGTTVSGGNGRGSAANQLSSPRDVFVDASGNIFIADTGNGRIQKWAPGATSGTTVAGGNGAGSAANQLYDPYGVFVDASGNIFIADKSNDRIQKWAPGATSGTTVAGGNGAGFAANQSSRPEDVFVDTSGNIYIVSGNKIQKWPPAATIATIVAGENNQLDGPSDVAVDAYGFMYISDKLNHRVVKWGQN